MADFPHEALAMDLDFDEPRVVDDVDQEVEADEFEHVLLPWNHDLAFKYEFAHSMTRFNLVGEHVFIVPTDTLRFYVVQDIEMENKQLLPLDVQALADVVIKKMTRVKLWRQIK